MKRNAFITALVLPLVAASLFVPALADVTIPAAFSGGMPLVYLIIAVVIIAEAIIAGVLRKKRRRKDGMR